MVCRGGEKQVLRGFVADALVGASDEDDGLGGGYVSCCICCFIHCCYLGVIGDDDDNNMVGSRRTRPRGLVLMVLVALDQSRCIQEILGGFNPEIS